MERNVMKLMDNGIIIFDGFDQIGKEQKLSINIFGHRKVVISLSIPDHVLECHNVIMVKEHKCDDPKLIEKLSAAGVERNSSFIFTTESYSIAI
jgi:hypothetical protein